MTRITDLIGIKYPIFQGGMAWVADWHIAAAVSEAGGLGIIGVGGADENWLRDQIKKCREATDKPFGVNLMLMNPRAPEIAKVIAEEKVKVVTTFTFSSAITFAISGALGFMSMRFTPNGLSVASLHFLIWSRSQFSSAPPTPMMPRPPASETAAAMCQSATQAIPPWKIGYLIPIKSVILVMTFNLLIYSRKTD